jgi:hypothetical protein
MREFPLIGPNDKPVGRISITEDMVEVLEEHLGLFDISYEYNLTTNHLLGFRIVLAPVTPGRRMIQEAKSIEDGR